MQSSSKEGVDHERQLSGQTGLWWQSAAPNLKLKPIPECYILRSGCQGGQAAVLEAATSSHKIWTMNNRWTGAGCSPPVEQVAHSRAFVWSKQLRVEMSCLIFRYGKKHWQAKKRRIDFFHYFQLPWHWFKFVSLRSESIVVWWVFPGISNLHYRHVWGKHRFSHTQKGVMFTFHWLTLWLIIFEPPFFLSAAQ